MPDNTCMFRVLIQGTLEDVWHEITRTDAPIPCFFNNRMDRGDLAAGSRLAMRSPDGKYTGVVGEILEVVPMRKFSHTFQFTNLDDPPSVVTYELEPKDGGVEFTLTVTDMTVGSKSAKQMTQGGKMIVDVLKSVVETGRPGFGTRMLFVLFRLMQPLSPKRCHSENWPVDNDPNDGET